MKPSLVGTDSLLIDSGLSQSTDFRSETQALLYGSPVSKGYVPNETMQPFQPENNVNKAKGRTHKMIRSVTREKQIAFCSVSSTNSGVGATTATLSTDRDDDEKDRAHDNENFQSTADEVHYNVKEVQWFNDQLMSSEQEAYAINERWALDGPDLLALSSEVTQPLSLAMSIIEVVREPLLLMDNIVTIMKANRAFYRTFGGSEKDTEQSSICALSKGSWNIPALVTLLEKTRLDYRAYEEVEIDAILSGMGHRTLRVNARQLSGGSMILLSVRDVTIRRQAEGELSRVQAELRQGQKMEVVGRLAGGVAHDFNNILTGILGFSELLIGDLEQGSRAQSQAIEIKKASERGASLTQQLLAFSRRQVLRPQVISLNTVILGLDQMLRRLIGENIELVNELGVDLGSMRADSGQIGQIVLNLAINARDAMPDGGDLLIRTQNTRIHTDDGPIRGLPKGEYVSLRVSDSGAGMDPETQQHIFEPFFTTKPQGSGTGLGLATVFGIVNQSGGHINFFSEPGSGTTFWIDFPLVVGNVASEGLPDGLELLSGNETILVVEDDDLVRELVIAILTSQGYTVLDVTRASQALKVCQSYQFQIDLILTDLLMPGGMDGRELTEQAVNMRKGMRVLLMSGYTTDALVKYGVEEGAPFLQKPFTVRQLSSKVREVLDRVPVS